MMERNKKSTAHEAGLYNNEKKAKYVMLNRRDNGELSLIEDNNITFKKTNNSKDLGYLFTIDKRNEMQVRTTLAESRTYITFLEIY